MTFKEFLKEYRQEIDSVIKRVCPDCRLNDQERRQWIFNDEGLYHWARAEGVRI
jgi:Leu/Phe-tRNA-protein transferase